MQRNNLPDHVGSPEERPCAYKATIHHGVSVVWGPDCGLVLETKVIQMFPKISPTRAFSWLKAPTSAFTFKTLFIKTLC